MTFCYQVFCNSDTLNVVAGFCRILQRELSQLSQGFLTKAWESLRKPKNQGLAEKLQGLSQLSHRDRNEKARKLLIPGLSHAAPTPSAPWGLRKAPSVK
jgi:hypothetical protein